jgi:hypothetical protein
MAGGPSVIPTEHIPNTNTNCYRYANPLGSDELVNYFVAAPYLELSRDQADLN